MTNLTWQFKSLLATGVIALLALSLVLWQRTPDLFLYFNQAFCAH